MLFSPNKSKLQQIRLRSHARSLLCVWMLAFVSMQFGFLDHEHAGTSVEAECAVCFFADNTPANTAKIDAQVSPAFRNDDSQSPTVVRVEYYAATYDHLSRAPPTY